MAIGVVAIINYKTIILFFIFLTIVLGSKFKLLKITKNERVGICTSTGIKSRNFMLIMKINV